MHVKKNISALTPLSRKKCLGWTILDSSLLCYSCTRQKNLCRRRTVIKVKTFATPIKIFHAREELDNLDRMVNTFIEENNIQKIISVSDACTTDYTGATIGLVRVLSYE